MTWQAVPELMGAEVSDTAVYFESCRALRNRSDYDRAGVVSATDVEEVIREAQAFRTLVLDWLVSEHRGLVP